jgi:hypothetical protein
MNQVPHPRMVVATVLSSVTKATWPAAFLRLWCLLWELFKCVTSYLTVPHCSLPDTKQVCGNVLMFSLRYMVLYWCSI